MAIRLQFLSIFIFLSLVACTSMGGGTSDIPSPIGSPGEINIPTSSQEDPTLPDPGTAAGTPTRPGFTIALDPHDEFFPVLVPDQGGPYILEECFHIPPEQPQCRYLTVSCQDLPDYTVEENPDNPDLCRIHEIIMLWGYCGFLDHCKSLKIQEPCPGSFKPCFPPIEKPEGPQILSPQDWEIPQ